jgi:hypothetical protein
METGLTYIFRVKVLRSWDEFVREEMFMPLRGNRGAEREVALPYLPFSIPGHIAMRRIRSRDEKERLVASRRVVKEPVDFGSQDICGVLTSIADGLVSVSLE